MVYKHKKCPKSLKSELLFVQFSDTKYVLGHSNYLDLGCVIKYLVPEIQKKCLDFRHMSENQTVFLFEIHTSRIADTFNTNNLGASLTTKQLSKFGRII